MASSVKSLLVITLVTVFILIYRLKIDDFYSELLRRIDDDNSNSAEDNDSNNVTNKTLLKVSSSKSRTEAANNSIGTSNESAIDTESRQKVILYWNDYFEAKNYFGSGTAPFANCGDCYITRDKSYKPIDEYDAIIFHAGESDLGEYGVPKKRDPKQRYVFYTMETPLSKLTIGDYSRDFFNWTMTYWRKSDIPVPYGEFAREPTNYVLPDGERLAERKKRTAAWFASNCKTHSGREAYVRRLQEYVDVDVYGACGPFNCTKSRRDECYQEVEDGYYYYLSFENALCEDYVTEKLFYLLRYDVVPVVYGRANYRRLAPPHSVIDVADFDGPRSLAEYLLRLKANATAYVAYFAWKRDHAIYTRYGADGVCELCRKLHADATAKTYRNLTEWWTGNCSDRRRISFVDAANNLFAG